MYMSTVLCIWALYYVYEHCIMYMSTVLCIWALYYVYEHCIMYMSTVLCIWALYYVYEHCIMYMSTVLCIWAMHKQLLQHKSVFVRKQIACEFNYTFSPYEVVYPTSLIFYFL